MPDDLTDWIDELDDVDTELLAGILDEEDTREAVLEVVDDQASSARALPPRLDGVVRMRVGAAEVIWAEVVEDIGDGSYRAKALNTTEVEAGIDHGHEVEACRDPQDPTRLYCDPEGHDND